MWLFRVFYHLCCCFLETVSHTRPQELGERPQAEEEAAAARAEEQGEGGGGARGRRGRRGATGLGAVTTALCGTLMRAAP